MASWHRGTVTQSMAGATFVAVNMLRGGLVELRTAIALCIGAGVGVTTLLLLVTLDANTIALCLSGVSAAVISSEHMASYRSIASAVIGAPPRSAVGGLQASFRICSIAQLRIRNARVAAIFPSVLT